MKQRFFKGMKAGRPEKSPKLPTEAQIAAACLEIRRNKPPGEKPKFRMGGRVIRMADVLAAYRGW